MSLPLILICAAPRTGTNHLCKVLSHIPELKVHTEVFARDCAYSASMDDLAAFSEITGIRWPEIGFDRLVRSPIVTQALYDDPGATLEALARTAGPQHKALVVKLFGYHLPRETTADLLAAPDTLPIVIDRRAIDAYASRLKAQKLQRWINVDTSRLKVGGDARDFRYWFDRNEDWYLHIREHVPEAPVPPLFWYEDAIAERGCHPIVDHIGRMVGLNEAANGPGYTRQDRNERIEDKIANWAEFSAELREAGYYDQAMRHFLDAG